MKEITCVDDMDGTVLSDNDKTSLLVTFEKYSQVYNRMVNRTMEKLLNVQPFSQVTVKKVLNKELKLIIEFAEEVAKDKKRSGPNAQLLLAAAFAWWTLSDCHAAVEAQRSKKTNAKKKKKTRKALEYLKVPHPAQVLSVFRLLGIEKPCNHDYILDPTEIGNDVPVKDMFSFAGADHTIPITLVNHLAEIKTGEGKSVTLAGLSVVLAMLDFHVDCVCFSQYLSNRDHDDFKALFEAFGVAHFIEYGTFNQLAEKMLNADGNIRELAKNFICGRRTRGSIDENRQRQRVLLIDEVDVFFHKSFYGNVYNPLASLGSDQFTALATQAWDMYKKT